MHKSLASLLGMLNRKRGVKYSITAPRGNAKSTWMSLCYPLRAALEGWEPYIILISDTGDQANLQLDALKEELETNSRIEKAYPHVFGKGPVWRSGVIELRNGVRIEALGTGKKIRGRRSGTTRPSCIVLDDPQNDENVLSPSQRDKDWEWLNRAVLKAGNKRTNFLMAGTALHRDCMVLRTREAPGWQNWLYKSVVSWPRHMDLWAEWEELYCSPNAKGREERALAFFRSHKEKMEIDAQVLWPAEEDLYMLMCLRAEGHAAFEAEKQGNPINPENCEWPASHFGDHIWFDEWPHSMNGNTFTVKTMSCDPSKGKDAKFGDYCAFVKLARDKDGILWIECDMARRTTDEIVAHGVELGSLFQPDMFGVESNAFQELLVNDFAEESKRRGIMLPISPILNTTNKQVRIRRLGPYLARKNMRFRRTPGTMMLVHQLMDFPNGDHDDGPDALEMALRIAIQMFNSGTQDPLGDRIRVS